MNTLLGAVAAIFILGLFFHKPLKSCIRVLPFCTPIGLAVTIVWLALLVMYLIGWQVDPTVLATIMGGSLVVHAYTLEHRNPRTAVLMVMAALMVTYAVLNERWWLLGGGVVVLALFWVAIVQKKPKKKDVLEP